MQVCTQNQSPSWWNDDRTPPDLIPATKTQPLRSDDDSKKFHPGDISPDDREIITDTINIRNCTNHTVDPINLGDTQPSKWNWEAVVTDPDKQVEICKTRSGRSVKPPVRYEPIEEVEDDDDCEDCESGVYDSEMRGESDDEDDEDDDDGSYDGSFINDDESDYEEGDGIDEEIEEEEEDTYTDTDTESEEEDDDVSVCDEKKNKMMDYYRSKKPRTNE